ncbi:hypothetical protein O3M35_002907 [Rhynocoris fuscipes]|uniref:Uncharacterized protein n=1 Tax=Rhynocoris fuscipes TaxID=488301 RepID=A0AAW1CNK9_9HEMI
MPGGLGGSYRSLSGDVYKSTTVNNSSDSKFNVIESVKKAFNFASTQRHSEPLLTQKDQPIIVPRKMPTSAAAEETALLG